MSPSRPPGLSIEHAAGSDQGAFDILLYYLYFDIEDPELYADQHRSLCETLGLRGRILIGKEGINGTVSGPREATDAYQNALREDPRSATIEFKVDPSADHVFPKLSIKVREEIVTLGLGAKDFSPNETSGTRLSPTEWHSAMQDENAVLIDGRNNYESDLGRFRGALCPDIDNFRDFPQWVEENREQLEGKKLLTYCTGGIRCEKLSGFLKNEGFDDVYQLEGGIVTYGKDEEVKGDGFDGLCYVFDERVGVEVNHTASHRLITECRACGKEHSEYSNCAWKSCNARIFICDTCAAESGTYCDDECRRNDEAGIVLTKEEQVARRAQAAHSK